jgi:hypothetical protein
MVCGMAHAFESFRGPQFANSSALTVDLSIVENGKTRTLIESFPAQKTLAIQESVQARSFSVTAGGRTFNLSEREYELQARGIVLTRQVWAFDGEEVCVVEQKRWRLLGHRCPARLAASAASN